MAENKESPGAEQNQQQSGGSEAERPDNSSGTNQWPSDIPGYVPQLKGDFSYIKEDKSTELYSQYYMIIYENIKDTADSYEEKLISNGWTIIVKDDFECSWVINASYGDDIAYLTVHVEKEDSSSFAFGIVC
ncbi:hypothetical protein [Candidatus Contubernalis alkaliaceticus]|uniref:hypothetical protein n=1 Tax=Candidatus Contubernalis alkaliaceticus TaxID=338645 RepID=UPI001F4BECD7|nr:hypothetical protein [Candidatus Contubernalis alkalaceticus]UNC93198.1 hypothetical protein HUE98_14545 [Candidatus Contubernalis alkalaceticus]